MHDFFAIKHLKLPYNCHNIYSIYTQSMYLVNCWTSTLSVDLVKILILTLPPRPTAQHSRALQHDRLQRAESVLTAGSPVATVLCWDVSQLAGLWLLQQYCETSTLFGNFEKITTLPPRKGTCANFNYEYQKSLRYHPVRGLWNEITMLPPR